jgi:hypothetical protein
MSDFHIADNQFKGLDSDAPDKGIIIEALQDVINELHSEGVWTSKGNYQLHFWHMQNSPNLIMCNAFVLSNPDNPNDSSTAPHYYYFEIKRI